MDGYWKVHEGKGAFQKQPRGLIAVWGKESKQFLNGMITNDIRKATEEETLSAAFANAQGRLMAVVRIKRLQDKFFFETAPETYEKVLNHLLRFTLAGDFFVEDLTREFEFFRTFNLVMEDFSFSNYVISFDSSFGKDFFVKRTENFTEKLRDTEANELSSEEFEILRIEAGEPRFGVDMDEGTVVPELGEEQLISYNKGCYVGQEIIARIHFRGHIAKQLKGVVFGDRIPIEPCSELLTIDNNRKAGYITSSTFSPYLNKTVALAYIRYDYLIEGTRLRTKNVEGTVKNLPFVNFSKRDKEK